MKVGDRARSLVAHGADPRAAADQSVPSARYKKMAARDLKLRAAMLVCGVAVTASGGWATGFRHLTPAQMIQQTQLADAGITPDQILPGDIADRLLLSPSDVKTANAILALGPQASPDMTWQDALNGYPAVSTGLPSREAALRSLVDYLVRLDPNVRPEALTQLRVEAGLTPTARDLTQALHNVPPSELHLVIPLLVAIMRMPVANRIALEQAGFPAVPSDAERQDLYRLIGQVSPDQGALIHAFLTDPNQRNALMRVDRLLQSRSTRRTLGGVADGVLKFGDQPNLPPRCDISVPSSCGSTR